MNWVSSQLFELVLLVILPCDLCVGELAFDGWTSYGVGSGLLCMGGRPSFGSEQVLEEPIYLPTFLVLCVGFGWCIG